jgi:hypothetical protein
MFTVGTAYDWSPLKNVALLAVPDPSLAVATVPEVIFEALMAVRATPLPDTLVKVPVVAVKVPLTLKLPVEPDNPFIKLVPSQYTRHVAPLGIFTPVPEAPMTRMA